jgi:hypothetical protein
MGYGLPAAIGAQVFPGFRPSDAGSHGRTNGAATAESVDFITPGGVR